jgi:beta-phosphoglucomutase-like phosphatase (HAD superfamily)
VTLAAVIFDFDGVLADSEPVHLAAFQQVLATVGIELSADEYYARYLGFSDRDAFIEVHRDKGLALDPSELERLLHVKHDVFPLLVGEHGLFPGARACVERVAAEVPVAIASGALRHEIELLLERGGLSGRVPIIVAAGETLRSKPHPDPYARAFELLVAKGYIPADTETARVVALEDSEWGLQSARGAGLRTLGVTTSYTAEHLPSAEVTVADIDAVTLPLLRSIVAQPARHVVTRA